MSLISPLAQRVKAILFRLYVLHHRWMHRIGVLPYSRTFGLERGKPVGRYYVEKFLRENAHRVRGRCLEFGAARYRPLFPQAEAYQVIDVVPRPGVDFVCDIHDVSSMPAAAFDTIICTQVFEHLAYPERAARSIAALLKPGGLLLLTAPFINNVHYDPDDFRRFTPECLQMILEDAGFRVEDVSFGGNSLVGTGSLLGMVTEDFTVAEMEMKDPVYPYNVLIRAVTPTRL
jgi:SAM-dependent methyltransferase